MNTLLFEVNCLFFSDPTGVYYQKRWAKEIVMLKRIMYALLLVPVILPSAVSAQICTEVTGQTVSFNLAAGTRAPWNPTATILKPTLRSEKRSLFSVDQFSAGRIRFKTTGFAPEANLQISLFTLHGRCIGTVAMQDRSYATYGRLLPSGVYLARCSAEGMVAQSVHFVVAGKP